MTTSLLLALIVATFVTVVLIPPLVRLAERLHAYDLPGTRKVHERPIPRLGGVAMVVGTVLPLLLWAPLDAQLVAYLCGVGIILVFGVWDDVRNLGYGLKFLGQVVAALVVIVFGDVVIRSLPFGGLDPLPDAIAIPLTLVALVGITNAINLADGLDGLAGGITLLSLTAIGLLAYPVGAAGVLLPAAAVGGSIVGFLRFNTYPARIFMGDGGSQFLGFSAGVLAVVLTQQAHPSLSPALPLLLLGLPVLDTAMVIGERLWEGRSPFKPDQNHLHHKLLSLRLHHYEAVFAIYVLQTLLLGAAYFLRYESDALIVAVYLVFCVALLGVLKFAIGHQWRLRERPHPRQAPFVPGWLQWLREGKRVLKAAFYFTVIAIPVYLVLAASLVERVPLDVWLLACGLLAVVFVLYLRGQGQPFTLVERACAYIVCASVVYLVYLAPGALAGFNVYRNVLFAGMTIAVVIGIRLSQERFRLTPMDFLIVLLALVIPSVLRIEDAPAAVGSPAVAVIMVVILFYGVEMVLNNIWRRWDVMRFTVIATLAVLVLRGMPLAFR